MCMIVVKVRELGYGGWAAFLTIIREIFHPLFLFSPSCRGVMIHTMVDFNYVATLKGLSNEQDKRLQNEKWLEFQFVHDF
jgi:hypothetical protein